jgi:hypothetical protein
MGGTWLTSIIMKPLGNSVKSLNSYSDIWHPKANNSKTY